MTPKASFYRLTLTDYATFVPKVSNSLVNSSTSDTSNCKCFKRKDVLQGSVMVYVALKVLFAALRLGCLS